MQERLNARPRDASKISQLWKKLWNRIRNRVLWQINQNLTSRFPALYREGFTGSDSFWPLFIKNFLRPKRILVKLAYGQIPSLRLAPFFTAATKLPRGIEKNPQITAWVNQFNQDGYLILPAYFKNEIAGIAERYTAAFDKKSSTTALTVRYLSLLDKAFLTIPLQEKLLSLIGQMMGAQAYLQDIPVITVVNPVGSLDGEFPQEESGVPVTEWHCDAPNTIKAMVLLNDIGPSDTHMKIAKSSHRMHRVSLGQSDVLYTDAYIRGKYTVTDCVGPKGTLTVFHSNALHRQHRVPGSFRAALAAKYSPGNHFLFERLRQNSHFEACRAYDILNTMPLSILQRKTLKGLLEKNPRPKSLTSAE